MSKRRQFLKTVFGWMSATGLNKFRLLNAGTEPVTPLEEFRIMGLTDYEEDLAQWRLKISGRVTSPLTLTYAEVTSLPCIEKEVLLNCPRKQ